MARERSPSRDLAFELWKNSNGKLALKEIANQLNVSDSQIRKWKNVDDWEGKLNSNVTIANGNVTNENKGNVTKKGAPKGNKNAVGHGAPKGNKNAVGNNGGAPLRNVNALKTGEYETIWLDCLSPEEQDLYEQIDTDELVQIEQTIRLLTIMERRKLVRIQQLIDGLTEKEIKILSQRQNKGEIIQVYKDDGDPYYQHRDKYEMIVAEMTETEFRKIDDIIKQEQILLSVQERKAKQLQLKHKLEVDRKRLALVIEEQKLRIEKLKIEVDKQNIVSLGDNNPYTDLSTDELKKLIYNE